MYSIAICDDNKEFARSLHNMCSEILAGEATFKLSLYNSADELLRAISVGNRIDLLFLDIVLGEKNGIELAKALRSKGYNISVVLMSADSSYLLEGYSVQPIYFLLKPVTKDRIREAISIDLERRRQSETITVKSGQQLISLTVESIIYLEVLDHVLTIHTRAGNFAVGLTMTRLLEMLPEDRFSRCHKSYAVHLSSVASVSRLGGVKLSDGTAIPLGRKYYEEFQRSLIEFMNRK